MPIDEPFAHECYAHTPRSQRCCNTFGIRLRRLGLHVRMVWDAWRSDTADGYSGETTATNHDYHHSDHHSRRRSTDGVTDTYRTKITRWCLINTGSRERRRLLPLPSQSIMVASPRNRTWRSRRCRYSHLHVHIPGQEEESCRAKGERAGDRGRKEAERIG
jgi:hypothetical protein